MNICRKGTWNDRMRIETALSLVVVVCVCFETYSSLSDYIQTRLAYGSAMFKELLDLFHSIHLDTDPNKMSIAGSSL
jgi:hypothetical protein